MLVYHFLPANHALDDIEKKRIKLSKIDELNDPFELWCMGQEDSRIRGELRRWKKAMARKFGLLCFSSQWRNPLLWSHYADSHRGICLGFEVNEESIAAVRYVNNRADFSLPLTESTMRQLLLTKYSDWHYEEEWRGWFSLEEHDSNGRYFYDFDEKVRLREIIVGTLCELGKAKIDAALSAYKDCIRIRKARLAFRRFSIVENMRGFHQ